MFKKKIQCVTEQTIRKLMYIWAGKYACLLGDIKKERAVGVGLCCGGCHGYLHNSPKLPPVLNKYVVFSKHLLCAYYVPCILLEEVKENKERNSWSPDLVVTDLRYPFCKGNKPQVYKYVYSKGGLLNTEMKYFFLFLKLLARCFHA